MEEKPENKSHLYSKKDYWDNRFEKTQDYFDWYVGWSELKEIVKPLINNNSKILMVGCGNSKLSENMYTENYHNIVNIDISGIVIDKMNQEKDKKKMNKMIYSEMDATSMTYDDNSFDFSLDKGTFDALSCSPTNELCFRMLQEMHRVTKINGYYVMITHSGTNIRLPMILDCLDFGTYELSYKKVDLSMLSNFINALKTHKNNKNVSMKDAIKDKGILMESLLEVMQQKSNNNNEKEKVEEKSKEEQNETNEGEKNYNKNNESKVDKLVKYLKLMKMMKEYKNKKSGEKEEEKGENKMKNTEEETIKETEETEKKEEKEEKVEEKTTSKNLRRDHVHCYIFKKVK